MSDDAFKEILAYGIGRKLYGGGGAAQNEADNRTRERQHKEMLDAIKANTREIRAAGRSSDWIAVTKDVATVGITDFAQNELGDIVFIQLPAIGDVVEAGEPCVSVETLTEPRDINAPLTGKVVAVNEVLNQNPELVNSAPESEGWLYKIKVTKPAQLKAFGI